MLPATQKLTETSVYVQRVAHREWQEFMAALDEYVEQQMLDLVKASSDTLPQVQGRAQALAEMRKILREAPNIMQKIEKSKVDARPEHTRRIGL